MKNESQKMKIIIIEGPDNTGKNTLINEILDNNEVVKIIHCGKPKKKGNALDEQYQSFKRLAEIGTEDYLNNREEVLIYNRFHIGEYVYGQIYRNEDPEEIKKMIGIIESRILARVPQEDIVYIQLLSTSDELLKKNDDNKSLSNAQIDLIKREQELFKEAFDFSAFKNKHIIYVNQDGKDEFRDRQDIINEFIQ